MNPTPVTTVTIPYIKGTSETISRILQPYNIRIAHKPTTTLRHLLTNVKDASVQFTFYPFKCIFFFCRCFHAGKSGFPDSVKIYNSEFAVVFIRR